MHWILRHRGSTSAAGFRLQATTLPAHDLRQAYPSVARSRGHTARCTGLNRSGISDKGPPSFAFWGTQVSAELADDGGVHQNASVEDLPWPRKMARRTGCLRWTRQVFAGSRLPQMHGYVSRKFGEMTVAYERKRLAHHAASILRCGSAASFAGKPGQTK